MTTVEIKGLLVIGWAEDKIMPVWVGLLYECPDL